MIQINPLIVPNSFHYICFPKHSFVENSFCDYIKYSLSIKILPFLLWKTIYRMQSWRLSGAA